MIRVPVRTPFDWNGLLTWLGTRAIAGVESVESGVYVRGAVRAWYEEETSVHRRGSFAAVVCGTEAAAAARDDTAGSTQDSGLSTQDLPRRIRRLFDLDADPSAIQATLKRDRTLAPLLRKRPGVRVPGAWEPFELAVRAIVGQQVSVAGARTILGRIAAAHGITPEALSQVTVEGMPRKRAETIRLLATEIVGGSVILGQSDLTRLPGIGPWTAGYIAMRLGDGDAFPAGDLVLRRNAGNLSERELLKRAEAWRPFRAYAAMLLWMQ
jgi:AraC family transcriptional regulator of adaptative response / DNA-3-methyladenine glycosylase II